MRKIKFRGRRIKFKHKGELVYGYFAMNGRQALIWHDGVGSIVAPDSVVQLVGYDANGKEVYEGDTVIRYDSEAEFNECPENGVLRQINEIEPPITILDGYYCLLKEE